MHNPIFQYILLNFEYDINGVLIFRHPPNPAYIADTNANSTIMQTWTILL